MTVKAARDELTEDERLLLAASGGWAIAWCLDGSEYGIEHLFESRLACSVVPAVEELRPAWKDRSAFFTVDRGAIRLEFHSPAHDDDAPVFVTRKRLQAYALTLDPEIRQQLSRWRKLTQRQVSTLVWSALALPGDPYRPPPADPVPAAARHVNSSRTANVARVINEHEYEPVETLPLLEKVADLRAAWQTGQPLTGGQLFGLPPLEGDVWVDMAGASVLTGLAPRTITSWLSRGGPKACPFPLPSKFLGRLHWPATTLLTWSAGYESTRHAAGTR